MVPFSVTSLVSRPDRPAARAPSVDFRLLLPRISRLVNGSRRRSGLYVYPCGSSSGAAGAGAAGAGIRGAGCEAGFAGIALGADAGAAAACDADAEGGVGLGADAWGAVRTP